MYLDMYSELRGAVPKIPVALCKRLINRAWADVRRQNLWSFQLYDGPQWIAPALVNTGLATAVQGSSQVTVNAAAAVAINAASTTYSLITQRQFRIAAGTIYNIYGWDGVDTLTLDRPYGEASITGSTYTVYQVYFAAPYRDHLTFTSVRDMQNFIDLALNKTRAMLDEADPQRSFYFFPTDAVFYQQDQNPASPTYQYPLYELWGAPQYSLNWQLYGIRRGADMSANTDTLPPAVGEDVVLEKAKYYAYQWAESQKGAMVRNQGPDWKFLMKESSTEYARLYKEYRRQDRELVDNWFAIRRLDSRGPFAYYSTISATAYPGIAW